MKRILLEGGIVILLVLVGISVFVPKGNDVSNIIFDLENDLESDKEIEDGIMDNVETGLYDDSNFIARINGKITNAIVNGLNNLLDLGMVILRKIIN
jgi:hypothetical protein